MIHKQDALDISSMGSLSNYHREKPDQPQAQHPWHRGDGHRGRGRALQVHHGPEEEDGKVQEVPGGEDHGTQAGLGEK